MSIDKIIESPTQHDFYQAVYTIQRQLMAGKDQHRMVGHDSLPNNELIRFCADQQLGFPGQAITDVSENVDHNDERSVDMLVSFMGLTGPSGVLPQHYSELILQRLKLKDTGMKDFFDMFNHRLISLYYRVWEKYRFPVNFQHSSDKAQDSFSKVIGHLSGSTPVKKYYAGIYSRKIRSVDGLQQILSDFTQCDVSIEQFVGRWQALAPHEQTRLGSRQDPEGQYACLGEDASIGSRVWDINSAIQINIKPNQNQHSDKFLPGRENAVALNELISSYLGNSVTFKINLEIQQKSVPVVQLSKSSASLGMGVGLMPRDIDSDKAVTISL